ncbi:unnamed protein product [Arabidopsis arenosa]|uniref:MBD domain-containing protein n=1 Tax=Arabidopsis arenosa TaxID=38785 RepID=A0A8S1ZQQ2_ARAAE|nr:unnamed protein product [Arabidopsis arenosa]
MTTTPDWIMIGGEGPESYNQQLLEVAKEKMTEAISVNLSLDLISNRFSIADFGCASGTNTFVSVQNIIDAVEEKYRRETGQKPANNIEFQVLFNDFSVNDFNTLFQTLPQGRRYYSAGVPGSFFARVLPKESFHIGVMSYTFHLTSKLKIPKGIMDRDSPLWSKDMQCTGFNQAVKKSYLDQYSIDTNNLLDARAEELVPWGLMLLLRSCLRDGVKMSETPKGKVMDLIGESLKQSEIRQIIEENEKLTIKAFEDIIHSKNDFPLDPKILAVSYKAFSGAFISAHFGIETMGKAFELAENRHGIPKTPQGLKRILVVRRSGEKADVYYETEAPKRKRLKCFKDVAKFIEDNEQFNDMKI